ncbi:metal-sulfur cluster assembly factor [Candidatus Woesearchaeota archaeon]|nr:metal-sulfur cluster assembly factor [Candidatus Woesearchaeota archaeon]HIH38102.1 metal-sulfur cluster assembly factor [Candidatus Woesearchaeota archaeon]HIH48836.1 metal-sulfur cluster assembly factor [Candidatus Woesearchaeota archaeon]HIJ03165.1 metal-sulfur cluster assembly factor [Candidatus Woesearchaeota archaeon]
MTIKDKILDGLRAVLDPEIHIDVVTLELIRDVAIDEEKVTVLMTLTSPLCPYGPMLMEEVKTKAEEVSGKTVQIELTFDPPWEPSQDLRDSLMYG